MSPALADCGHLPLSWEATWTAPEPARGQASLVCPALVRLLVRLGVTSERGSAQGPQARSRHRAYGREGHFWSTLESWCWDCRGESYTAPAPNRLL